MKPRILILFLVLKFNLFGQISFFKELNNVEAGSNPSNFIEFKGEVYFTIETIDGKRLWKTDGTTIGTVEVSDKRIRDIYSNGFESIYFTNNVLSVCGNELYFAAYKNLINGTIEIWKTDGINISLAGNQTYIPEFCFNSNQIFPENNNNFYIDKRQILNNNLISFKTILNNNYELEVSKTDKSTLIKQKIGTIDSLSPQFTKAYLFENNTIVTNSGVYFIVKRFTKEYKNYFEIWQTDGNSLNKVSTIASNLLFQKENIKVVSFNAFNQNLIYLLNENDINVDKNTSLKLYISDLNSNISTQIGNINGAKVDVNNRTFGFLQDKFCFANEYNGDTELWISDGTQEGTILLKDLNPVGSSHPKNFESINGKVYFTTESNELWQTDGTSEGTIFLSNIPMPAELNAINDRLEYIFNNNGLIFKNYSIQNGYELWKRDNTLSAPQLIKNIVSNKGKSIGSNIKVKFGNYYYFNGCNINGCELWKTDGSNINTLQVKDLNNGSKGTQINEMVVANNFIYFTGRFSGETNDRLFRSDGTENGTIEIPLISGHPTVGVNPSKIRSFGNDIVFYGLYVKPGTNYLSSSIFKVNHIELTLTIYELPTNISSYSNPAILNENYYYLSNNRDGVYKLNLLTGISERVFGGDYRYNPRNLIEFNNKIYFLSYKPNNDNLPFERGLFESDGTQIGTKIVKSFINDPLFLDESLLFLEKSNNRLFFKANQINYNNSNSTFELWCSNGSLSGTYKLKNITTNHSNYNVYTFLNFYSTGNTFYLINWNIRNFSERKLEIWASEGLETNTNKVLDLQLADNPTSYSNFNGKLYFSVYTSNFGSELWESDGTFLGTKLTAEIRVGQASSQISNLMNFDDKLLMTGTDGSTGIPLWRYSDPSQIKSVKSGNWDDPTTWNTGIVPANSSNVTIEAGHSVTIPAAINANLFTIIIKTGGILEIGNGSSLILNNQY